MLGRPHDFEVCAARDSRDASGRAPSARSHFGALDNASGVENLRRSWLVLIAILVGCEGLEESDDGLDGECESGLTLMGDSLTSRPGWADLVIESFEPGFVRRAALGGLETRHFLPDQVLSKVLQVRTCDVMILLGTNDSTNRVPWEEFLENYEIIIDDLIESHGVERIIVNIPPMRFDGRGNLRIAQAELLFLYRMLLLDLCARDTEDEIECGIDLFMHLSLSHFLSDGTHFNMPGHIRVYELVAEVLPIPRLVEVEMFRAPR